MAKKKTSLSKPKPIARSPKLEARSSQRTYSIPDYRLEKPDFTLRQIRVGDQVRYDVESDDLSNPAPPIRESKYLTKQQLIEIYRWMLLNRRMESALERLYKQSKVVGGVYFGLGQEACSCASAYALDKDEWVAPMIRNQGSLLVRGFAPRDMMMQYMAKAGSPTGGTGRHLAFRRPEAQKRRLADFHAGRPDSSHGRRGSRRTPAGQEHRRHDLHRRRRTVHRRHL